MTPKEKIHSIPSSFWPRLATEETLRNTVRNKWSSAQSDPADAIFYIQKGKVKLTVVSDNGKEAVIAILGIGDFLGEGCLAGRSLYLATATAMSECSIVRIGRNRA